VNNTDWGTIFLLGLFALVTTIIVVVVIQVMSVARARITTDNGDHYRALAESYDRLATESASAQQSAAVELNALRSRIDSMEKLMREVE
jgi:hypothetical protein